MLEQSGGGGDGRQVTGGSRAWFSFQGLLVRFLT